MTSQSTQNEDVKFAQEGLKPFLQSTGYSPMQAGNASKALTGYIRYCGQVMLTDALIRRLIREGRTPGTSEENRIKPMSRMAYFRAGQKEQDAHERKIKEAGKEKVYSLVASDGTYLPIGSYAYEYAKYLYALRIEANVESAGVF